MTIAINQPEAFTCCFCSPFGRSIGIPLIMFGLVVLPISELILIFQVDLRLSKSIQRQEQQRN